MNENGKINILVDGHFLTGLAQGTRSYIIGLYKAFIENYSNYYNIFISGHNEDEILGLLPIPKKNYVQYKSTSNIIRLLFELPLIIKKNKIDFAHFQQITPLIKNCKHINTVHDVLFNEYPEYFTTSFRWSRNILFKYSLKNSDVKLTISEYSKSQIAKDFLINFDDIYITPNGVAPSLSDNYDKLTVKDEIFKHFKINNYILFVSRLEPRKNHLELLSAFLELKLYAKCIHLVFVGKKVTNDKKLEEKIQNITPEAKAYFHHFENIDDETLLNIYKAADLFVYPSFAEGFGIPPLEAAAIGIPVICSNQTAMLDFKELGITMFNPKIKNDLKNKMEELTKKGIEDSLLENIKKLVIQQYSWDKSASVLNQQIQKKVNR
jgi:glycosyltransferase involved in cell wall biosynthesis